MFHKVKLNVPYQWFIFHLGKGPPRSLLYRGIPHTILDWCENHMTLVCTPHYIGVCESPQQSKLLLLHPKPHLTLNFSIFKLLFCSVIGLQERVKINLITEIHYLLKDFPPGWFMNASNLRR